MTDVVPKIACVGPRRITREQAAFAERVGRFLVSSGFGLASGNAVGSDQAFAKGGNSIDPKMVCLYLPWEGYNPQFVHKDNQVIVEVSERLLEWAEIAVKCHPKPHSLDATSRMLLTRTSGILQDANQCLLGGPPRDDERGGTAHAVRVATFLKIPVLDISSADGRGRIRKKMGL